MLPAPIPRRIREKMEQVIGASWEWRKSAAGVFLSLSSRAAPEFRDAERRQERDPEDVGSLEVDSRHSLNALTSQFHFLAPFFGQIGPPWVGLFDEWYRYSSRTAWMLAHTWECPESAFKSPSSSGSLSRAHRNCGSLSIRDDRGGEGGGNKAERCNTRRKAFNEQSA